MLLVSVQPAYAQTTPAETAQGSAAEDISVAFGFGGEIVADAWNPLRVTLRDQEPAELLLELDVGNLRQGPSVVRYRAPLSAETGLYTFEDDVYLPAWRAFSWVVRTPDQVLASGSVERRRADPKPLQLVLARDISEGNRYFGDDVRVVDVLPDELPERAAAYDGVDSLLVLPSTTPPAAGAAAAAATAGATVVLAGQLGTSHDPVLALAARPAQRLGAGWLVRVGSSTPASVRSGLAYRGLKPRDLLPALLAPELTRTPPNPSVTLVLAALAAYALVAGLLLGFGRTPGLLAALLLAGALSLGAERLRPDELLLLRSRTLSLGAGDLALEADLETLFSYPNQMAALPYPLAPLEVGAIPDWTVGPEHFSADLPRYQNLALRGKPRLSAAVLERQNQQLSNLSDRPLSDVYDSEIGRQGVLGAGARQDEVGGDLIPPELYTDLIPLLPEGSVVARSGGTLYVALPQPQVEAGQLETGQLEAGQP